MRAEWSPHSAGHPVCSGAQWVSRRSDELLSASVSWAQVGVALLPTTQKWEFGTSLSNVQSIFLNHLPCLPLSVEDDLHKVMDFVWLSFLPMESSRSDV